MNQKEKQELKERRQKYFPINHQDKFHLKKKNTDEFNYCLHCQTVEIRLVKIYFTLEINEADKPTGKILQVVSQTIIEMCPNSKCWTYIDFDKLKTWKRI